MNNGVYGGQGPLLVGLVWAESLVAFLLVAARIYTATQVVQDFGFDSLLAVATVFLGLISQIFLTVSVSYGLGNHSNNLTPHESSLAIMWCWIAMSIAIFAIALGKLVVIVFILRVQGRTNQKKAWLLYFLAATNTFINLFETILVMLQCDPARKLWQPDLPGNCDVRERINSKSGFVQGAWNTVTDLILAIYPVFLIGGLQMPLKLKIGLCGLMATGLFTAACAAVKTWEIHNNMVTTDVTHALSPLALWNWTELWVTLVAGSVAPLWPLVMRAVRSRSSGSKRYMPTLGAVPPSGTWNPPAYSGSHGSRSSSIPLKQLNATVARDSRSDSREHIIPALQTTHVAVDPERLGNDEEGSISRLGRGTQEIVTSPEPGRAY